MASTTYTDLPSLNGEDRTFGGNDLFVDLTPWFSQAQNIRTFIRPTDWNKLRKYIYTRINYICECCGTSTKHIKGGMDAHERWDYNIETNTQILKRLVGLCKLCHQATHIGLSRKFGRYDETKTHLQKVRNFTDEECEKHITSAYELMRERNGVEWVVDLSMLELNGIQKRDFNDPKSIKRIFSGKLDLPSTPSAIEENSTTVYVPSSDVVRAKSVGVLNNEAGHYHYVLNTNDKYDAIIKEWGKERPRIYLLKARETDKVITIDGAKYNYNVKKWFCYDNCARKGALIAKWEGIHEDDIRKILNN